MRMTIEKLATIISRLILREDLLINFIVNEVIVFLSKDFSVVCRQIKLSFIVTHWIFLRKRFI